MSRFRSALLIGLGVAALAVPAGAIADHGEGQGMAKGHAKKGKAKGHAKNHGHGEGNGHGKAKGHSKPHDVGYVFKGLYAGEDTVDVKRGNAHVRKADLIGEMVEFDFSDARFVVADANGDGNRSIDDVEIGDWVLVKARLPREDPGSEPFEADRLIDKSDPPADDGQL